MIISKLGERLFGKIQHMLTHTDCISMLHMYVCVYNVSYAMYSWDMLILKLSPIVYLTFELSWVPRFIFAKSGSLINILVSHFNLILFCIIFLVSIMPGK